MKYLALFLALLLLACEERSAVPPTEWPAWCAWVEARSPVTDAQGHGPEIGSDEWARALQWKLAIVDAEGHGPDIGSAEWRAAVESKLR